MIRSYIVKYRSTTPGELLIGAVKEGQSHRWGSLECANQYLQSVIDINGGTKRCTGEVVPSILAPEGIPHCDGHPEQGKGGKCFGCGKIITQQDLYEWRPKTLYQLLKASGVELASHKSDLYCPVTEETTKILKQFYYPHHNSTTYTSTADGKLWYDIPFSYDPFWEAKMVK